MPQSRADHPRPSLCGWFVDLFEPAASYVQSQPSAPMDMDAVAALAQARLYLFDAPGLAPLLDRLRAGPAPYASLGHALRAEDALRRGDLDGAEAALALLANAPAPLRAWAGLCGVDVLERGGRIEEAEQALEHCPWSRLDEPPLLRPLMQGRLHFRHGEVAAAVAVLEAASSQCELAPPPLVATFQRTLAIYFSVRGDGARGMQHHRLALEAFRRLGDTFMLAKEYLSLSQTYLAGDELDHAEFFLRKAAEVIEQFDNDQLAALLPARRGILALMRGELGLARELFERDLALCVRAGFRHGQGFARRNLGKVMARLGEPREGCRLLGEALADFVAMGDDFNEHLTRLEEASALLAGVASELDAEHVKRQLEQVSAFFRRIDRPELLTQVAAVRARLLLADGKLELACSEMAAAGRDMLTEKRPERLIESLLLFADSCLRRGLDSAASEHLAWAYKESMKASRPGLSGVILDRLGLIDERAVMDLAGTAASAPGEERQKPEQFEEFLLASRSHLAREVVKEARRVAPTDETVLVEGETGVGKGVLARFIHATSRRATGPLFALNCGALAETLIESELFGHEKGAFTGAQSRRVGVLEAADGGVVFLDELGELSPRAQVMLLRFLEDRQVRPVGSSTMRRVDVRVIAATNRNLLDEVREGRFRRDLYYRLAVWPIRIPPLRERLADLPELAAFILARTPHAQEKGITKISPAAHKRLAEHAWPGNLRELDNVIRAASIRCQSTQIGQQDLPSGLGDVAQGDGTFPTLATVTRRHVTQALRLCGGNQSKAAELLGVHRNTLGAKAREMAKG